MQKQIIVSHTQEMEYTILPGIFLFAFLLTVLVLVSWLCVKKSVQVEKNKGVLTEERLRRQIKRYEKWLKIDSILFVGYSAVVLVVEIITFPNTSNYGYVISAVIAVVTVCFTLRWWLRVYYYNKELDKFVNNG